MRISPFLIKQKGMVNRPTIGDTKGFEGNPWITNEILNTEHKARTNRGGGPSPNNPSNCAQYKKNLKT